MNGYQVILLIGVLLGTGMGWFLRQLVAKLRKENYDKSDSTKD